MKNIIGWILNILGLFICTLFLITAIEISLESFICAACVEIGTVMFLAGMTMRD